MSGRSGSTITLNNERLTIFEALSQANQPIDPYDIKDKIWLIREDSGKRYFVNLDLNSKKIFESPYYYLRNNDLIYLKPGKFSSVNSSSSPFRASISVLGSIGSLLGFILLLKNIL
jgi:polysaccharide export outer membrane protein